MVRSLWLEPNSYAFLPSQYCADSRARRSRRTGTALCSTTFRAVPFRGGPGAVAAIKEGMVQIVRAFREKLVAFRFLPRTERKLKEFVNFN